MALAHTLHSFTGALATGVLAAGMLAAGAVAEDAQTAGAPVLLQYKMRAAAGGKAIAPEAVSAIDCEAELLDGALLADGVLKLDGKSARAAAAEHIRLDALLADFTVILKLKADALPAADNYTLLTKRPNWTSVKPFSLLAFRSGAVALNFHDGAWRQQASRPGILKPGEWQIFILTYRAGDVAALYCGGEKLFSLPTPAALSGNAERFVIGYEKGKNDTGFAGEVAELTILTRALNAEEVARAAAGTLPLRKATEAELPRRGLAAAALQSLLITPEADALLEASLVFDATPQARGLWFRPEGLRAVEPKVKSGVKAAWAAGAGSAVGVAWGRSVFLNLLDPRFRDGKMPVVDLEIVCMNPNASGITVWADTASGPAQIYKVWGNDKDFKTLRIALDNARFSGADAGNPLRQMSSDGYDLRINGNNEDLLIRSIKVTGYDLDRNPDFARLLKLTDVAAQVTGENAGRNIFLFSRRDAATLEYRLRNLARVSFEGRALWQIVSHGGKEIGSGASPLRAAGQTEASIRVALPLEGLPNDIYSVKLRLLQTTDAGEKAVGTYETFFGVTTSGMLAKAKRGEFLYGLDMMLGSPWKEPLMLEWATALGADILRGGGTLEELDEAMPIYRKAGLQVMAMPDPRYEADPAKMREANDRLAKLAGELAARHKDIRFWEIGNEPDLPFFYKGPIEAYYENYLAIHKAIKDANPDTIVSNGGLSFHGKDGIERSRRLLEIMDPDRIDAFGYHGHGPLVAAERSAYERIMTTLREFKKDHKPLIETETGVAADKPGQERMQARTVIEKFVYGQSVGLPALFWFRLRFEHERSYGNLHLTPPLLKQPRPAVLAYRALVQTLRGYRFERNLGLHDPKLEGYLFRQMDGTGRVCVLWANIPGSFSLLLNAAAQDADIRNPEQLDLYGNAASAQILPGGALQVAVTDDPVFLRWQAADPAYAVKLATPLIGVAPVLRLVDAPQTGADSASIPAAPKPQTQEPAATEGLTVTVRNPFGQPMQARLRARSDSPRLALTEPAPLTLAAGESKNLTLGLRLLPKRPQLLWPQVWTVFTKLQDDGLNLAALRDIPSELPGINGPVRGRRVQPAAYAIDLDRLAGGHGERWLAALFAEIDSPQEQTVTIGSSADWWMAWYVNGQPVYNTLNGGNGAGFGITDHTFAIPLKKGRNLLAVKVYSGSGGWRFLSGGPAELAAYKSGSAGERLELALELGGKELVRQSAAVEIIAPLPRQTLPFWATAPVELAASAPALARLSEESLVNLYEKQPDKRMWWGGDADLSASVWLSADAQWVYLLAAVTDDVAQHPQKAEEMWKADSLQLAIARSADAAQLEYCAGLLDGKPVVYRHKGTEGAGVAAATEARATIERGMLDGREVIFYRLAVSRDAIGDELPRLNVLINDNDAGYRKQWLRLRPGFGDGNDPSLWLPVALR